MPACQKATSCSYSVKLRICEKQQNRTKYIFFKSTIRQINKMRLFFTEKIPFWLKLWVYIYYKMINSFLSIDLEKHL